MDNIICGTSLLFREWLPYHKVNRRLTDDELSIVIDCWHFAIYNGITEIRSVMRCVNHLLLMWFKDFGLPGNRGLFIRVIVNMVHTVIGQNKEDEIVIGNDFGSGKEIFDLQKKILEYPIHHFMEYLDRRFEINYADEIRAISRLYSTHTDEDIPNYLLIHILGNYKTELEKMEGGESDLCVIMEIIDELEYN